MSVLDAKAAAEMLGVSPQRVRQLIDQGALDAVRVGRSWAIEPASVYRRLHHGAPPGRPYSPQQARRAADLADLVIRPEDGSIHLVEVKRHDSAHARWQAFRHLESLARLGDPDAAAARLRHRASGLVTLYAHPSVIDRLDGDARLSVSGPRAAAAHGADLLPDDLVEAYVDRSHLDAVIGDYALEPSDRDSANVWLRPVDEPLHGARVAPLLYVLADLAERDDVRARQAAGKLLDRIRRSLDTVAPSR